MERNPDAVQSGPPAEATPECSEEHSSVQAAPRPGRPRLAPFGTFHGHTASEGKCPSKPVPASWPRLLLAMPVDRPLASVPMSPPEN